MNEILDRFEIKTSIATKDDSIDNFINQIPKDLLDSIGDRRRDLFILGRLAASKLQSSLNLPNSVVLKDSDGVPIFQNELKASISHKERVAVCAGTLNKNVISIGVDVEKQKSIRPDLISTIGTVNEQKQINLLDNSEILTLFSLKESIYKAVFPIIRRPLYFKDAEIGLKPNPYIKALNAPEIPLDSVHLASLSIDGYIFTYCIVTKL